MDDRWRRLRRVLAVLGSALLAFGVLVPASTATAAPVARAAAGPVAPMAVPPATGNNAVITVRVGADREGISGVSGLAGVTLQLYDGGTGGPTTPVAEDWATCVSDADGDCSFVVPDTQEGVFGCFGSNVGANCDRRFWIVQTGVPDGFVENEALRTGNGDGSGSQATAYRFRTGTQLRAGQTYSSTSDFMIGTGSTNRTASGGIWQQSRTNPDPLQQCGLSVGLVLDLSGSLSQSQLASLKAAADTFVDSLVGTPSQVALFSFSTTTPATGATQNYPGLTSVSTTAGADEVKARYASWTAGGGTNWDRGLATVAEAGQAYDIAIVITDGDPTFYSQPAEGPGNFTRLREMENGIFSANAIKAEGTRVLAVGVGAGVSDTTTRLNLAAISGPVRYDGSNAATADYYQVADYSVVGDALRELALGDCTGSLSVVKQLVGADGDITNATPGGAGWQFDASTTTPGVTLDAPSQTTDETSAVNFPITYTGGTTDGVVEVQEQVQSGTQVFPVGGFNAVCTNLDTQESVPVTNVGTGFSVDVLTTAAVSCTVYNQVAGPATVTVDKEWVINGADPVPEGSEPPGFGSTLTLTGPGGAGATEQEWGVTRSGYLAGDSVTIDESVLLQAPDIDPDLCTVGQPQLVEIDGAPAAEPFPAAGYSTTLVEGDNTFTVRNTVTCESRLTLTKTVEGTADPTTWTLSALPGPDTPAGQLPGPTGTTGSTGATDVTVTSGVPYQLAEAGGPATYVQDDQRSDLQTYPLSTGSWACIRIDESGAQIPGFADGLNGGVTVPLASRVSCEATNRTATLYLVKEVVNDDGGTAVPADFTLRATPGTEPPVTGLETVEVAGSAEPAPAEIRPGHPYTLDETGPDGYTLTSLECVVDDVSTPTTEVTLAAGQSAVCTFVNDDAPAQLTLRKVVEAGTTGATQTPADWTLTATPQDVPDQPVVSGNGADGVTAVEVVAGAYALTESEVAGFEAGAWTCVDGGGAAVPVTDGVVTLAVGSAVTCTITNTAQQPTLTLVKELTNDDGGTSTTDDWTLTATGPTAGVTGVTGDPAVTDRDVSVGTYTLSEAGPAGYVAGDWTCTADGSAVPVTDDAVDVTVGAAVVCTITNDDAPALLTLRKVVDNGTTGATATPADWTVRAAPEDIPGQETVEGDGEDGVTDVPVSAGSYALSESFVTGYSAGEWTCVDAGGQDVPLDSGTLTLANGDDVTCSITNTAVPSTLTLVKTVQNDNGGTAEPRDFVLVAVGPTTTRSGRTGDDVITEAPVEVGQHALSEGEGPDGYVANDWACSDGDTELPVEDDTVLIGLGQDVTCSVLNDDLPATLTLVKDVVNDHGGTAEAGDWTLTADGPTTGVSGASGSEAVTGVDVSAGDYALSETGPDGYVPSAWTCEGGVLTGDTVTVANGETVTCTITNTFDAPRLTLVKQVVNGGTGTAVPADWTLTADGEETVTGASGSPEVTDVPVTPGSYALTEDGPAGYTQEGWLCEDAAGPVDVTDDAVELAVGDDVTCTVTNIDDSATATWTATKTSNPVTGSVVDPGTVVTYTVTATVVTGTEVANVVLTDDLAQVLDDATLVTGSIAATTGTPSVAGTVLTWDVGTLTGTQTLTYQVRVDGDAYGATLRNVVTAPGALPCDPVVAPAALTGGARRGAAVAQAALTGGSADQAVTTAALTLAPLAVVDPEECRTTTVRVTEPPGSGGTVRPPTTGAGFLGLTGGAALLAGLAGLVLVAAGTAALAWRRRATG